MLVGIGIFGIFNLGMLKGIFCSARSLFSESRVFNLAIVFGKYCCLEVTGTDQEELGEKR